MDEKEKAAFRKKIAAELVKMTERIIQLEEASQPISPENSIGRISRMDAINNKSVSEAALRSAKRKESKLKMALSKLESEDFGNCSACGQPIPPMRLLYMPESTYCVRCAEHRRL